MVICGYSMPMMPIIMEFQVDHPFIMLLQARLEKSTTLFYGKIMKPVYN